MPIPKAFILSAAIGIVVLSTIEGCGEGPRPQKPFDAPPKVPSGASIPGIDSSSQLEKSPSDSLDEVVEPKGEDVELPPSELTETEAARLFRQAGGSYRREAQNDGSVAGRLDLGSTRKSELRHIAVIGDVHTLDLMEVKNKGDFELRQLAHFPNLLSLEILRLHDVDCTSEGFKELSAFKNLKSLSLSARRLDDSGLAALSDLRQLSMLSLRSCRQLNGTGFQELGTLDGLRVLKLSFCPISNEGADSISRLGSLQEIDLSNTKITDDGVQYLARLGHLTELDIGFNTTTDKSVGYLAGLTELQVLHIGNLTDAGLKQLAEFSNLRELVICQSKQITDDGLKALLKLRSLGVLRLYGSSGVTKRGLDDFRRGKPNCDVTGG